MCLQSHFFYISAMFGNDCLQRKPSGKLVFKLGSVALRLDVDICMWVYQQLKKASTGRLFCWLIHRKGSILSLTLFTGLHIEKVWKLQGLYANLIFL